MQTLGCPPHVHPTSCRQSTPEQPSPLSVWPSSQVSAPRMKPSPQIGLQVLGVPTQLKPASTWHVNEQPSPLVALPSSQASGPRSRPSPQIGTQLLGTPEQSQPGSI